MRVLTAKLYRGALILLFPMVVMSSGALATDYQPVDHPACQTSFTLTLERVRLLSQDQIGLFFHLADHCGRSRALDPDAFSGVSLDGKAVPVWRLNWIAGINPRQGIQSLKGYKQSFISESSQTRQSVQNALAAGKLANRIEIRGIGKEIAKETEITTSEATLDESVRDVLTTDETRTKDALLKSLRHTLGANRLEIDQYNNDVSSSNKTERSDSKQIQSFSQALNKLSGFSGRDTTQVIIKGKPSRQLIDLITGLNINNGPLGETGRLSRLINLDNQNNTEYRQFADYLNRQFINPIGKGDKEKREEPPPFSFSSQTEVTFVNAEIIDQTSARDERKRWRYRPEKVEVRTASYPRSTGNINNPSEIKSFFDTFETSVGDNVLSLNINDYKRAATLQMIVNITAPDLKNYQFHITLYLHNILPDHYRCHDQDGVLLCAVRQSLEVADLDLLASWNGKVPASRWTIKNEELKNRFEAKEYATCLDLIESELNPERIPTQIPVPLAADWLFMVAESRFYLNQPDIAVTWYRKIARDYPYSQHTAKAWYRLTEINGNFTFD